MTPDNPLKKVAKDSAKNALKSTAARAIGPKSSQNPSDDPASSVTHASTADAPGHGTRQSPTPHSAAASPADAARTTTKPTAKEEAADIAAGAVVAAAKGALQGAGAGGAAGAAVGAVKGVALNLATDRRVQRYVLMGVAMFVVLIVMVVSLIAIAGSSLAGAVNAGKEQNATLSVDQSGVSDASTQKALQDAQKFSLPWTLVLAATQKSKTVNLAAVAASLDRLDPSHQYRDLTAGSEYQWDQRALAISKQADRKALADQVQKVNTEALVAGGLSEGDAETAYKQALSWALGEDQCTAPTSGNDSATASLSGSGTSIGGSSFTANETANMQAIIGDAKTMFPGNAEQAAIVGLATAAVESGFQNYANDGKIGPEDGLSATLQGQDYKELEYSLTLDHDAVGSDHTSLGIMQQQATYSWGDIPGSTWSTDPDGVIKRLMTPAFAAAKFFQRMATISGWESQEPGAVAQAVQVSAFPDAYAQKVDLAKAIWAKYGDSTSATPLPAGIDWSGDTGAAGSGSTGSSSSSGCVAQTASSTVPSGDEQALAKQIIAATDRGEIIWWGNLDETLNQVKRYADGDPIPAACTDDPRVFQIILLADSLFHKLSVNSLNRRCTGATPGIGTASYHWKGKAVDFGFLGGENTTGADPNSIKLIKAYAAVAPPEAGAGQLGCFGRGKVTTNLLEFPDSCTHLHLDLGPTDDPLKGSAG